MGSELTLTASVYNVLRQRESLIGFSIVSIIIYYVMTIILSWRRLRHIPGPPLATISYLWGFLTIASGESHIRFSKAQKKYGKVMRIGPDAIMVYDPETLRRLSSVRSAYGRGGFYQSMRVHPGGESVLSELNTSVHDKRKANLIGGFAGKNLANLERDLDSQIAGLVQYIRTKAPGGKSSRLDFSKFVRWFQLDVLTLVTVGKAWGDLEDETDHFGFLEGMDAVMPVTHSISVTPFLRKIVFSKLFLYLAGMSDRSDKGLGKSIREMRSTVQSRFKGINETVSERKNRGMLDEWIKGGYTPAQCESDLLIIIPAGAETTISVIRSTFLHILSSPIVYQKLKKEISDAIKAGTISQPITHEQAKGMPYLQAVISEGMRMIPPVVNGFSKQVPLGGDTICGKYIPEGVEVHANFIALLMNPEIFGEDAEVFRPERFLECDEKQRNDMLKTMDLSFGHGRWLCLGKSLALLELNKIYVELLRAFDFQIVHPEHPWKRKTYSSPIIDDFELRIWENPLD